ncbi:MAG: hypothetical protein QOF76_1353 [Solirubrobacteraceae bacterium]|jgi:hypothetical protein|nr:hypothetical protein [Solirubrobacteraceae bacterium]
MDGSEAAGLLPSGGVLVVWAVLMAKTGGFHAKDWLPAGFALVALLGASVIGQRRAVPDGRAARLALGCLAGLTAWCYLSIAWSDAPGVAWESSNLLLLALLSTWTLSLARWRTATVQGLLLGFSFSAAIVCFAALVSATGATDLTSRFVDFRFSAPLDYPNATAAFAFMAAFPALVYAARPDGNIALRGLCQGVAGLLGAYALLPQSRGSILSVSVALVVLVIVTPFRWRMLLHLALMLGAVALFISPAHDLYRSVVDTGKASAQLDTALHRLILIALVSTVAGAAAAWLEAQTTLSANARRWTWRLGWAATWLVVVAVAAGCVAKSSSLSNTVSDEWRSLRHPGIAFAGSRANVSDNRLNSVDPLERYDYWRVSADGFLDDPIGGMGAGGFVHRYTIDRRYEKLATFPHNLVVKVLGDTGLIGLLLVLGYLVGAAGMLRRLRYASPGDAAVRAAAVAVTTYFLVHGMFDWLEAYPVLVGPALGFPVVALASRGRDERLEDLVAGTAKPPRRRRDRPRWARPAAWAGGTAVALAAFAALFAPWLGVRYQDRARDEARVDVAAAYLDLSRAADANPLNPEPLVLRGVLALSNGDMSIARSSFERAIDREDTWLPHFGLGLAAAASHDVPVAQTQFAAVHRLNPRNPALQQLMGRALIARDVAPATVLAEALANPLAARKPVS